jgi:TPR repeat protein
MRLGEIYHHGRYGVTQDFAFAQELYLKARELGNTKAWDAYLRAISDETDREIYPWLYK